jgi:lactate dehydrogenase-like 2-hydroxyacid dehydrogenase
MTLLNSQHFYNALHDNQKAHTWDVGPLRDDLNKSTDSVGQRIGILGYGSIGRQVARVSRAMGMDVLAYTASAKDTPDSKKDKDYFVPGTGDADGEIPSAWYSGLDRKSLHNFLKQDLDFLLVSVPLT